MTNIKKQISETLKWKKHPSYCAAKLNITEKQYIKIKKQILYERKKHKKIYFSKVGSFRDPRMLQGFVNRDSFFWIDRQQRLQEGIKIGILSRNNLC